MTQPAGASATQRPKVRAEHALAVATSLAALAGYIDAVGYIRFSGLFVSFMSGNSTQGAVAIGIDNARVIELVRVVVSFVVGVALGELLRNTSQRWGRTLVLGLDVLFLAGAVVGDRYGLGDYLVADLLALAMGVQNASVGKPSGTNVSITYITGTLVNVGRGIGNALRGAAAWRDILPFCILWTGFVCGGLAGAQVMRHHDLNALAIGVGIGGLLVLWSLLLAATAGHDTAA